MPGQTVSTFTPRRFRAHTAGGNTGWSTTTDVFNAAFFKLIELLAILFLATANQVLPTTGNDSYYDILNVSGHALESSDTITAGHSNVDHLSMMMFYDFEWDKQQNFTNVVFGDSSVSIENITKVYELSNHTVPGMVQVFPEVFASLKKRPHAHHWKKEAKKFIRMLKPMLKTGSAIGAFLGDELQCTQGFSYENITNVANYLRKHLGPYAILYTNECGWPFTQWKKIPEALDLISVDIYDENNVNGTDEVFKARNYIEKMIKPLMNTTYQKLLLVPGIYASSEGNCQNASITFRNNTDNPTPLPYCDHKNATLCSCKTLGKACPVNGTNSQATQVVKKLDGFFEWAKNDSTIAGFNPWHFKDRSGPQLAGCNDQRLGAESMPEVVERLRKIGRYIIDNKNKSKREIGQ